MGAVGRSGQESDVPAAGQVRVFKIRLQTASLFYFVTPRSTLWCFGIGGMSSSHWGNFSLGTGLAGMGEKGPANLPRAAPPPAPAEGQARLYPERGPERKLTLSAQGPVSNSCTGVAVLLEGTVLLASSTSLEGRPSSWMVGLSRRDPVQESPTSWLSFEPLCCPFVQQVSAGHLLCATCDLGSGDTMGESGAGSCPASCIPVGRPRRTGRWGRRPYRV